MTSDEEGQERPSRGQRAVGGGSSRLDRDEGGPERPPLKVIRLTLEYDGTRYLGWQVQPQGPTIQAELERVLAQMTGESLRVTGAGRTDSGVHALGQVASFRTRSVIPAPGFAKGLTRLLPPDIAVVDAADAPPEFEARGSARGKLYRYSILNRPCRSPLASRFAWHVRTPLDERAMAEASAALVGRHDFSAFRTADPAERSPIQRLDRLSVRRVDERVEIEVEASGFLRYMVRIIAGTLVEVGRGARPPSSVAAALASRDRAAAGPTAPPHGLCLVAVRYAGADSLSTPVVGPDDVAPHDILARLRGR